MNDKPTPEEIDKFTKWLEQGEAHEAALEAHEYDGVLGLPPEWVPKPALERFRETRDRVLNDWGYTPNLAVEWLDRFRRIGEKNDDWFFPGKYPCGRHLNPNNFTEKIGFLAYLRWAVALGPKEGLEELAGESAAQGYAVREGSKNPRMDELRRLMEKTYLNLRKPEHEPESREVLDKLSVFDHAEDLHKTVQEIDWDKETIYWCDRRGREKSTTFKTLYDRMTRIRKKYLT